MEHANYIHLLLPSSIIIPPSPTLLPPLPPTHPSSTTPLNPHPLHFFALQEQLWAVHILLKLAEVPSGLARLQVLECTPSLC
jgi:hypothetical protein